MKRIIYKSISMILAVAIIDYCARTNAGKKQKAIYEKIGYKLGSETR